MAGWRERFVDRGYAEIASMNKKREIALVYRKMHISEQGSDLEYWLSQPPGARLAALEEIRREYHGWSTDEEPRIEKVVNIIRHCSKEQE